MRFLGVVLGALMAMGAFAMPLTAQAQTQQVVSQFDDATIARLLLDVKTTWQVEPGTDGRSIYRASADGGINFTLMPQACAPEQGCRAIMVIATFTRGDTRSLAELDTFLNVFNDQVPSAKAYRTGDGTVILQSYINAAFGISYANAQAQLLVFGQDIQAIRAGLTEFGEGR